MNTRKGLRILCADDNKHVGEMLVCLLARAGHEPEHVDDGLAAWDALSKDLGHFDVLITDHQMPGLDGLELVDLVRQANYRGRIVVFSAALTDQGREGYRTLGVDGIIAKGTDAKALLDVVASLREA